jgi:uncharacterized membrane protein
MIKQFLIFGCLGIVMEVFWTGFCGLLKGDKELRGFTSIWMFPIYGSAVFFEPIYVSLKNFPVAVRGCVYMVLIFAAEYASGFILEKTLGECPWDYKDSKMNVYGLIRIDYAPVWFIAGLLMESVFKIIM